eukprot:13972207-Heterocapsa_arctica.AAC.1
MSVTYKGTGKGKDSSGRLAHHVVYHNEDGTVHITTEFEEVEEHPPPPNLWAEVDGPPLASNMKKQRGLPRPPGVTEWP